MGTRILEHVDRAFDPNAREPCFSLLDELGFALLKGRERRDGDEFLGGHEVRMPEAALELRDPSAARKAGTLNPRDRSNRSEALAAEGRSNIRP